MRVAGEPGERPGCICIIWGNLLKMQITSITPRDFDSGCVQGDLKNLYFCEAV